MSVLVAGFMPSENLHAAILREERIMNVRVIDDRDGYVLVARSDGRCAVVERRAGHFYNLHGGERPPVPCDLGAIPLITDENDWVDEAAARTSMMAAVRRQAELAQRLR
jgi:hypothetical protein